MSGSASLVSLTLSVSLAGGVLLAGVSTMAGLGAALVLFVTGAALGKGLVATAIGLVVLLGAGLAAASPTAELLVVFPAVQNTWLSQVKASRPKGLPASAGNVTLRTVCNSQ
jgi:hypothetical protein